MRCKILGFFLLLSVLVRAETLVQPFAQIELQNSVVSMTKIQNTLYVATDFGEVIAINPDDRSQTLLVKLPLVTTFLDNLYAPKIFYVDTLDHQRFLITSESDKGGKNLFLYHQQLEQIFSQNDSLHIKKAAFISQDKIFLALASNEIILYDLNHKQFSYRIQLSEAPFSDFWLSEDRQYFLVSCESGILYFGNTLEGKVLVKLEGANKDKVYQSLMSLNAKGERIVISAGQDRKVGVYTLKNDLSYTYYALGADFLVYSVGLNPNGTLGAFNSDENSMISVFDIATKEETAKLIGHQNVLNAIIFLGDKKIVSAEDGKNILFWELP